MNGLMLMTVDAAKTKFRRIGLWTIIVSKVEKHSRVFGVVIEPFWEGWPGGHDGGAAQNHYYLSLPQCEIENCERKKGSER